MGSFGPKEANPESGKPYGLQCPVITIADMVRAQALLMDTLGIEKLHCIIGGSMGGMQVLEWLSLYPERVHRARFPSPPQRVIRPKTSPSMKSAVRPSWPIPNGMAVPTWKNVASPVAAWP